MIRKDGLQECLGALAIQPLFFEEILNSQGKDPKLLKLKKQAREGKAERFFVHEDGGLRFNGRWCLPTRETSLKERILDEAHCAKFSVHPGDDKMYQDLKLMFWWSGMEKDIAEYVLRCLTCQKVKSKHKRPGGLLQTLEIPVWKWDDISMDFVLGLPRTKAGNDALWVIVYRLTKSARFFPMNCRWEMKQLARAYVKYVVRVHGVPRTIVSDRDTRYLSQFWQTLQQAMGTTLLYSTSFHPQTDGQTERTNQILKDMLRAVAMEYALVLVES